MKETAKRRKKRNVEVDRLTRLLKIVKRKIQNLPTTRHLLLEKDYQKQIYLLKNPEMTDLPSETRAYNMYERSEVCTKAQFSSYKTQAKQSWINKLKVGTWEEDKDPVFNGETNTAKEVGEEFRKYYDMLFTKKKTVERHTSKLLGILGKSKILKSSAEMLDKWITKEEVAEVMETFW